MAVITPDMVDVIERAILSFVATVNEDNTPNLSPKASLTVRENNLYFANIASPVTVRNLRRNPAVEINVVDIFSRRGYRFKGTASVIAPGASEYRTIAEWVWATNGQNYPVHDVVKINVVEAKPLLSPAYIFGGDLDENKIREVFFAKYGVVRQNAGTCD